jgi:hypothetical protein
MLRKVKVVTVQEAYIGAPRKLYSFVAGIAAFLILAVAVIAYGRTFERGYYILRSVGGGIVDNDKLPVPEILMYNASYGIGDQPCPVVHRQYDAEERCGSGFHALIAVCVRVG